METSGGGGFETVTDESDNGPDNINDGSSDPEGGDPGGGDLGGGGTGGGGSQETSGDGGGDGGDGGGGDGRTAAERVSALEQRVVELESELRSAREALRKSELRTEIDAALIGAGALDLETGRLVLEHELERMDEPDVEAALARAQAGKPFLFGAGGSGRGGRDGGGSGSTAMAAGLPPSGAREDLNALAAGIRETGDRRELMRYLRMRRGA
mgnify:CR=1 FL=1